MDQQLKDLKATLRSLVVSCPTQVDVRTLMQDYRNMMGGKLPIDKYGYKNPVQFLRERCSDCFVFQGSPVNPVLTLIVPDSLKHIDNFVQKQKLSSTVKFKGKRRSIPEQIVRPQQHLIASTYVPDAQPQRKQPPKPVEIKTNNTLSKNDMQCKEKESNNSRTSHQPNINNEKPMLSKESTVQGKENKHVNKDNHMVNSENCTQSALNNFLRKRSALYNSTHNVDSEKSYEIGSSKEDDDSGRLTSSSRSSTKAARLGELKTEIRDLIAEYPDGVWCTDLISLYRAKYKRELNFTRFGYTSIVSFVCTLEDAVNISRTLDKGDWLLKDARSAATAPRPRRPRPASAARRPAGAGARADPDDALPGVDFDPDVFPTDCMHFMESIPVAPLAALETGAMLEVLVGEVYSPSHFWLLRLGEQHNIAMEDLMDEMTQYYTFGEGKDRSLALGAVRVGHYCSSVYERDWHRSLIVRIVDSDTVKVRHVDYGTVDTMRVTDLKPLRREWGQLPAQAIRARLAGVRPPAAGRRWPHAASAHLLALVRDRRLVANVVCVDRQEDILEVFLIDTTTDEDICISSELIRSGHAEARGDSALRTPECYLFPRFEALESGDTPNFGEIHAYLRDGIALEYVEEYRRHVPACLPPCTPSPPSPPSPPASLPDSGTADDDASSADEPPPTPARQPTPQKRAVTPVTVEIPPMSPRPRSASSPGEISPPRVPPGRPIRSVSAHPNIVAPDAPHEIINRVPLFPQRQDPTPNSLPCQSPRHLHRFLPPVRTPLAHAYSQMFPVPYAGFPPFPGAVPLYPPIYSPPMMMHPPFPPYGPPMAAPAPAPQFPPPRQQAPPEPQRLTTTPRSEVSPPPPCNSSQPEPARATGRMPAGEVTLSVSECEIFKLLSRVDANAAHWYMVDAISRAMRTEPTGSAAPLSALDPNAPEFRAPAATQAPFPPAATQAPFPPAATQAPLPPAATQAPLPPAATRAPLPPAATQARLPLPPGMRPPPGFGD